MNADTGAVNDRHCTSRAGKPADGRYDRLGSGGGSGGGRQSAFDANDSASIAAADGYLRGCGHGVVLARTPTEIHVLMRREPKVMPVIASTKLRWRIDKSWNEVALARARAAVRLVCGGGAPVPSWLRRVLLQCSAVYVRDSNPHRLGIDSKDPQRPTGACGSASLLTGPGVLTSKGTPGAAGTSTRPPSAGGLQLESGAAAVPNAFYETSDEEVDERDSATLMWPPSAPAPQLASRQQDGRLERPLDDDDTNAHIFRAEAAAGRLDAMEDFLTVCATLNESQKQAIRTSLHHAVSVIKGPPGTGKTSTVVHLMQLWRRVQRAAGSGLTVAEQPPHGSATGSKRRVGAFVIAEALAEVCRPESRTTFARKSLHDLLRGDPSAAYELLGDGQRVLEELDVRFAPRLAPGGPVLAVAASNTAVDQLADSARRHGMRVVRIGDAIRVRPSLLECTLDVAMRAHPGWDSVQSLLDATDRMANRLARSMQPARKATDDPRRKQATPGGHRAEARGPATINAAPQRPVAWAPIWENLEREHDSIKRIDANTLSDALSAYLRAHRELSVQAVKFAHRALNELCDRAGLLERSLARRVLREADVVCTTCVGAGHEVMTNQTFNLVIVDEASQVQEPELLIPLCRLNGARSQLVLVGDEKQLPPVVRAAEAAALGSSLFERIVQQCSRAEETPTAGQRETEAAEQHLPSSRTHDIHVPVSMLQSQYRMHPSISAWPNTAFYGGAIHDSLHLQTNDRIAHPSGGFPWPHKGEYRVAFVAVPDGEDVQHGTSRANHQEVVAVVRAILQLLSEDAENPIHAGDVGIITPYAAQVRLIVDALRHAGVPVSQGPKTHNVENAIDDDGETSGEDVAETGDVEEAPPRSAASPNRRTSGAIEVRTVDGFQGREKRVIVVSTVRANSEGDLGFVTDYRRMNVMLTRAQSGLIVVGHDATLRRDPVWASWLSFVDERGLRASLL